MHEYPFKPVEETLQQYLPDFDHQAVEAVLATILANRVEEGGKPVWLELIAPSSLGKTTILEPLEGLEGAKVLSKITPRTLLSGSITAGSEDPSLLTRLGSRPFIIVKELSTLLAEDPKVRGQIFAQLREVWDGHISQQYGNGVFREWRGKATVIVGITPHVDRFWSFESSMGERFLKLRFESRIDPEDLAMKALLRAGEEQDTNTMLHKAYKYALAEGRKALRSVKLSEKTAKAIAPTVSYLAKIRTPVERDRFRKNMVVLPPATEGTPRLSKAFWLLAHGLAALRGEKDLSKLDVLHRIAEDCMPEPRRSVLKRVIEHNMAGEEPQAAQLNGIVHPNYVYEVLDDLVLIGALEKTEEKLENGRSIGRYKLSNEILGWRERGKLPHGVIQTDLVGD